MDNDRYKIIAEDPVRVLEFKLPSILDAMEIDSLIESILQAISNEAGRPWIIDLSHTQYVGSSMLGLFVNMREIIRQSGGALVLCGLSPELVRIFRTCCLERLFQIAKSREEAKGLLRRR